VLKSPQPLAASRGGSSRTPGEVSGDLGAERLRHALWLLVCCLLLATLAFVTRPGNIIADTKIDMAIDPVSFLRRAMQLWDPAQFGQLQNQAVGYFFPMGPFFVLGRLMALSPWIVQRLWLTALFIAAFLGTVRLASRLGIGTAGTRIAAGFAYALAPRALSLMGVNSGEFLPAAMLPLILIPLVRLLRHGQEMDRRQKLRAAAQSAVAVALCSGMNAASVVAMLVLALIYVLAGQRSWSRWRVLAWWAPAVALATGWWTVPLLLLDKYGVSILPYSESAAITTSVTSLSNTLRGTEDWTTYLTVNGMPWWPVGFRISTTALPTVLTGLVAGLGLGGLLTRRMPERRFLLWALLAGIAIIGSGYVSGLGNPLVGPIDHVINGPLAPLRNIRKFDPLIRLPLALGLAQLLASIRVPRLAAAARLAAAGALAIVALPALTGGLTQSGDFLSFPPYWVSATNWLNAHAENQAVLAVPGARFGEYVWGRPMDDVLEALFSGNWASTQLAAIGSVGNTRLLDAIEQRVEAGQGSAGLTQLLQQMGVKYIVVRNDLIRSDLYGAWPARVHDALYSSPGIVKVAQFGSVPVGSSFPDNGVSTFDAPYPPVEIFRVNGAEPVATVMPAAGTIRVFGGSETLLNLADQGVLKGHPVLLNSDSPQLPVSHDIITDSLRRILRNFGEIRIDYTQTLTAKDPANTIEAANDYLEPGWQSDESVAQYHGIANVTASSSASGITALQNQWATGRMPFSAIDGDSRTMWESGSLAGPVHQWLQMDFDHAINPGTVRVAFADNALVGPAVTKVDMQTAAGTTADNVTPTANPQSLKVPRGASTWLRITVEAVEPEPYSLAGSQAGISEITVPGVHPSRTIMAPAVHMPSGMPTSVLLAKAEPQPTGCMLTSLRWVCSPYLLQPTEEEYGFDEGFTASDGYQATLTGLAVLTDTRLIARYAWSGKSEPQVTASSTYTSDPEDTAGSAFDGNLATEWIAGPSDRHPTLKIKWHGVREIKGVTVVMPPGAASPMQVLVRGSDGQVAGGIVGTSKRVIFARPMRTNELTLTFAPNQLPLEISEVRIPGVAPLKADDSARFSLKCGQGPTISVNGKLLPTRATGTYGDLLTGRPMSFAACSPAALRAGQNTVVESGSDPTGFDVQSVLLDPPGPSGLRADTVVHPAAAKTITWTNTRRVLSVSARQRSYLELAQNFNAGWQASLAGRTLQPVQLDGWEQGWLLPAGARGRVTLTYKPQKIYTDALFGGLALLVVLMGIAYTPLLRRRRMVTGRMASSPQPTDGPGQPSRFSRSVPVRTARVVAGVCTVTFLGLWTGGYPGAVLLPAATLLFLFVIGRTDDTAAGRWRRSLSSRWLVVVLMLLAATGGAIGDVLRDRGISTGAVTALWDTGPELLCLIVLARVAAELARLRHQKPAAHARSGGPMSGYG